MPAQPWFPHEEVVDAAGVPRALRLGKPVEVPLQELAFVTEEDLPAVLDPYALNCGNLVDIYQEREVDFQSLSRLEVNYLDGAGEQVWENLFVLDVEAHGFVPKGTPRVCMSVDTCRAMRRAIEVLTRKVDNLSMTLKSCREHYLKELTYLRNCRDTNEHNVAWFSPHVYEDNFTKIEIRRRLSFVAEQWKEERIEKNREIQMLRDKLSNAENDEDCLVNRFKVALKIIPLDQIVFCLKQSVEDDETREASFYGHIERLLAERQEQSYTPSNKNVSDKDGEKDYTQQIRDLSAKLGDAQERIAELEAEAASDNMQIHTRSPVKPERPPSARSRRLQAHRSVVPGNEWKAVVAAMESENNKLRKEIEEHAPKISELQEKLTFAEGDLDHKREIMRAKEHDYQHLSQELNSVRRQLQILKGESKKAVKHGNISRAKTGGLRPPEDESWSSASRDSVLSVMSTADRHSIVSECDGDTMTRIGSAGSSAGKKKTKLDRATTGRRLSGATKLDRSTTGRRLSGASKFRERKLSYSSSRRSSDAGNDSNIPSSFALGDSLLVPGRPRQVFVQVVRRVMICLRVLSVVFPKWKVAKKKSIADDEQHVWTSKGIEWACSTSSFVMLPEKGATVAQSHYALLRGMGNSLWTSLLAGHIEKIADVVPSAIVATTDETDFIWTSKGVEWAYSDGDFAVIPEIASKVTEAQLGIMQEIGGCTPGCLAQVCTSDNSAFVWTREGIAWACTSSTFPSIPEPGTQVSDEELQLIRSLGGAPSGGIACRVRKTRSLVDREDSGARMDEMPESLPPVTFEPPGIVNNEAASQMDSNSIELMFGELGELGEVPEDEELDREGIAESRRTSRTSVTGIDESMRPSLAKASRPRGIDVAAQTVITCDLCSSSWSCSTDLDGGHQQEGVLDGILRPGTVADGECIERFGEAEEAKSVLCSRDCNSIKWFKSLPKEFVVETKIKVLEPSFDEIIFGFSSGPHFDSVKLDCHGRAISLSGSHWVYIDDGRSTSLRSRTWCTLKFERTEGQLSLEIDGSPVLQNIPMNWHVDGLQWQPQRNVMSIAYLKAWPTLVFLPDRMVQETLLQSVQQELFQWCQNYLHAKCNVDGRRPLSARSYGSDGNNPGVRRLSGQIQSLDGCDIFGHSRRKLSQSRRCSLAEHSVSEDDRYCEEELDEALGRRIMQKSDAKQLRSMIDSRFSSLLGGDTSMQTNWSTTRSRKRDLGAWRAKTAQGGVSGRNAATILNTLSQKRQSAPDDEHLDDQVHMSLGGTYMRRLPR